MKVRWFIPIALLIPLRLSATDAAVGASRGSTSTSSCWEQPGRVEHSCEDRSRSQGDCRL